MPLEIMWGVVADAGTEERSNRGAEELRNKGHGAHSFDRGTPLALNRVSWRPCFSAKKLS